MTRLAARPASSVAAERSSVHSELPRAFGWLGKSYLAANRRPRGPAVFVVQR